MLNFESTRPVSRWARHFGALVLFTAGLGAGCDAATEPDGPPSSGTCAAGWTSCASGCVDVATSATDCGTCGNACPADKSCQAGQCTCQSPLVDCSGTCVDVKSSGLNCGSCGATCQAGQACSGGICKSGCDAPFVQCGSDCADLTSNAQHCGDCSIACPAGQVCTARACACSSGLTLCNGQCVSIATSPQNCGSCGAACPNGSSCVGGTCTSSATPAAGGTGGLPQQSSANTGGSPQQPPTNTGGLSSPGNTGGSPQQPPTNTGGSPQQPPTNTGGSPQEPPTNTGGSPQQQTGSCTSDSTVYSGHVTRYTLGGGPSCHTGTSGNPQYTAAMNEQDYNKAAACGACVEVTNPDNGQKLVVTIIDLCPVAGNETWCYNGSHHIDLTDSAYAAIGANNNPAVTWKYVSCDYSSNIQYVWESSASNGWLALTIKNHVNPIKSVELGASGSYTTLTRADYNVFSTQSLNAAPNSIRVTDIYGNVIEESISLQPGATVTGTQQFPKCG